MSMNVNGMKNEVEKQKIDIDMMLEKAYRRIPGEGEGEFIIALIGKMSQKIVQQVKEHDRDDVLLIKRDGLKRLALGEETVVQFKTVTDYCSFINNRKVNMVFLDGEEVLKGSDIMSVLHGGKMTIALLQDDAMKDQMYHTNQKGEQVCLVDVLITNVGVYKGKDGVYRAES